MTAVNADNATFLIRGAKNAYATQYAKMLRDIHDKTAQLAGDERTKKGAEIRANWATILEKARLEHPEKESDFTFHLPSKDSRLTYFDESTHYNRDKISAPASTPPGLTETQRIAMITLSGLKVGEFITVGFDNGVINNDAYIVIKGNKLSRLDDTKDGSELTGKK